MRRARWVGVVALLLALGGAITTGFYSYARLTPAAPQHTLTVGESVETLGVRYRLDSFTVAESLPAEKDDDPPVRGPAGSVIVLIVVTQTVLDRSVPLDEHTCEATLVADRGTGGGTGAATIWRAETDVTYALRRPEALGCGATSSTPLSYGVERPMGFSFVIPAAAAGGVSGRLSIDGDAAVIAFRP